MRRAAKRDIVESVIVEALTYAGAKVYRTLPSDLLVHHPRFGRGWFRVLECKSVKYSDKRQLKQRQFLDDTGAKKVLTPEDALHDCEL